MGDKMKEMDYFMLHNLLVFFHRHVSDSYLSSHIELSGLLGEINHHFLINL